MIWLAQPAVAAHLTYDCRLRITRVETIPPAANPDDPNAWQCKPPVTGKASHASHWQRNSLEYCRLTVNQFDVALDAARRIAKGRKPHSWVVLMDADETVLDNSLFERERDRCGVTNIDLQWDDWVKANMATDVPGAAAFTQAVHKMGGLVAIVTNRMQAADAQTRFVLDGAKIHYDYLIGKLAKTDLDDKTTRWQGAIAQLKQKFGGDPKGVMWLGDQVTDLAVLDGKGRILRAMSQKDQGTDIGVNLFLLPNPMYSTGTGGWMNNPDN